MRKILSGITFMVIAASSIYAVAAERNTSTMTVDAARFAPAIDSRGPVVNGKLTVVGKFMQIDLNTWQSGKGYAPSGRVGALTNNPFNCILDAADGGYQHRGDVGATPHASSGCAAPYFSSSPQTAPDTAMIANNATKIISSHISFDMAGTGFGLSGGVNFTLDPVRGTVSQMETIFTQDINDMGGGVPSSGHQLFDYSVGRFSDGSKPAAFFSMPTNDEVADNILSAGRKIPWSVSITQAMADAPESVIDRTDSGVNNGASFGAPLFSTVPGYVN